MKNDEQVEVTSRQNLRTWLSKHHEQSASIWLVTYKKHMGNRKADIPPFQLSQSE